MATTQRRLEQLGANLDESIGVRGPVASRPKLSPVASPRDIGRRPTRNVGRIQIDQLIPDPSQPRAKFSDESIQRLAKSLCEQGQLAPIRVRWSDSSGKWLIVCGERRWRAARVAKLDFIDCYFEEGDQSAPEVLERQMVENLLREDLKPSEQAQGFSALMELRGWNGKQVAKALNVPASTVSRALAILDLPPEIQQQVDDGVIAARSAYEISKVNDEGRRRELAKQAASGMTVKQTQEAVRRRPRKTRKRPVKKRLEFQAENGWRIVAIPPSNPKLRTYDCLKEAIDQVDEDVNARIRSNIRID